MADNTNVTVKELLTDISTNLSQKSSSHKDEVRVMQAMISDPSYEVTVYGKNGPEGTYSPTSDFRNMCASVMSHTAKISGNEAKQLMDGYTASKAEAEAMVGISKEFINTFIQTGRKLPLGSREKSDASLSLKKVEASTRLYPQKVGVNDNGSDRYVKTATSVPAHESIRVHAPCPSWVK
ncbi:MAG: hypothetical protein NC548_54125 [Lachnospiraceae bacterium]|nr:hypothetical protein [Lachnospiraceae bacterium]